jgi:hypothetical protein
MESKIAHSVLAAAALLSLTQLAGAQGTSGATGAVASIPGSVVRGHEQGPGLFSILTGSTLSNASLDSRPQSAVRPGKAERPSRQTSGK